MSKLKLLLSIGVILVGCWFAAKGKTSLFVDSVSIFIVILFAAIYAMAGTLELKDRVNKFGDGAVIGAWLGATIGLVSILSKVKVLDNPALPELDVYQAFAIVCVCLFWGYFLKFVSYLIAEN